MSVRQPRTLIRQQLRDGRTIYADLTGNGALAHLALFHRAGEALSELCRTVSFVDFILHVFENITIDEFC